MIKAILCDIDGVLLLDGDELFSIRYAREHSFDVSELDNFFQNVFPRALAGKADLRDILWEHRAEWHIATLQDRDTLFTQWVTDHGVFAAENIAALQQLATPVYAATNQEAYRGRYISEEIMPEGLFVKTYISANVGYAKPDINFFRHIFNDLTKDGVIDSPGEILFVDDDAKNIIGGERAGLLSVHYDGAQNMRAILTDNL